MQKTRGVLTLIPTPIDEDSPLEQSAFNLLKTQILESPDDTVIAIEDLKPGRRRWIKWGLPREQVDKFFLYNEHSAKEVSGMLLTQLNQGKNVFLMSDGGLPAFCDPGIELVSECHDNGIRVTSTPFPNSISLALAMSGFKHDKFIFEGFLPRETANRGPALISILNNRMTAIIMDTPYRLPKVLKEISDAMKKLRFNRRIFLAMDLNSKTEELIRGNIDTVIKKYDGSKREFIIIIE